MAAENSISWGQIALLVLGTGTATAIVTQICQWLRESRKDTAQRLSKARYLAMRIAIILERFGIDCANHIADNHISRQVDNVYQHITMPKLPPFPEEEAWEALDTKLLGAALTIRSEVMLSERFLKADEGIDPEFVGEVCDQQTGRCGFIALQAARELREHYRLPKFDPKASTWDIEKTLKIKHDAAIANAAENDYAVTD